MTGVRKELREKALAHYGHRCEACRSDGPRLAVHHLICRQSGRPDVEDMHTLMILCPRCHGVATSVVHGRITERNLLIMFLVGYREGRWRTERERAGRLRSALRRLWHKVQHG
jgi:hypothetical protein